ncbi:MAG: CstA-like transporter-associated (seleno)protein [Candidatus Acidiferrales bacterium]
MNALRYHAFGFVHGVWAWIRQVSGDAAYENYLCSMRRTAAYDSQASMQARSELLSRADFYLDALRRRYSSVSRCC